MWKKLSFEAPAESIFILLPGAPFSWKSFCSSHNAAEILVGEYWLKIGLLCTKQLSKTTVSIISHTTAAAGVQVELAIECNPPMEPCCLSYTVFICIINSGRSVKNGSNHNASKGVGGP